MQNLFPEFKDQNTHIKQRSYVMRRLKEMAADGTLYLTDALNHAKPIPDLVGMCILGHEIQHGGVFREGRNVPAELKSYQVRVVAIPHVIQKDTLTPEGHTQSRLEEVVTAITFKAGEESVDEETSYEASKEIGDAYAELQHVRPIIVETGKTDVTLPLDQALWCLRQQGANIRRAKSLRLQRKLWLVREVPPGEQPDASRPTGKRARRGGQVLSEATDAR
jgi:hypothetical protein